MAQTISIRELPWLYVEGADDVLVVLRSTELEDTDPKLVPVNGHIHEHRMRPVFCKTKSDYDSDQAMQVRIYFSLNHPELLRSLREDGYSEADMAAAFRVLDLGQPLRNESP